MSVSRRLRFEILRRDAHACRYCGSKAPAVALTVDHVVPVALGGTDDATNLVTACKDCNAGKAATNPDAAVVANVADDALRWAAAMERASDFDRYYRESARADAQEWLLAWNAWHIADEDTPFPLPNDWRPSVERFLGLGFELQELKGLVEDAMVAYGVAVDNRFRYFCGVCWSIVHERQGIARTLIDNEDRHGS